jgi:DNA-directed RNA polymerase I, II, and III subunit RPABC1
MLTDQRQNIDLLNNISNHELEVIHRQSDNIFQIYINDHMKVIYYLNSKFKFADLKKFIQTKDNENITNIVLIFKDKINSFNPKNIEEFNNINLQIFLIKELLFNISKHNLVPKHEVIKDQTEISELVKHYNLKSKLQFPIILKTDPMARYLNVQSSEIVKVTRVSPSAGESILYRCCV